MSKKDRQKHQEKTRSEAPKATAARPTVEGTTAWFVTGKDGFANKRKLDQAAKVAKDRSAMRFRLKEGEEAVIIFLDSEPFFIYEHNLKLGGKYGNFFTCRKQMGTPCGIEETDSQLRPTYTGYLSVIDRRSYTVERQGKTEEHRDTKKLFPAKGSAIMIVEDLIKKYGDLRGRAFKVKRYSKDDPNCGTSFEFLKKVDLEKNFGKEGSTPFDYMKKLVPPTAEELANLGFGMNVAGSEQDIADTGKSNIPDALKDLV